MKKLVIIVGIVLGILAGGSLYYARFLFGGADEAGFRAALFRASKAITGATEVRIGEITAAGPLNFAARNINIVRHGKSLLHIETLEAGTFPLSAALGNIFIQGEMSLKNGGIIKFLVTIPPQDMRNLATANANTLKLALRDVPLRAFIKAVAAETSRANPVTLKRGVVTGQIDFSDPEEFATKTATFSMSMSDVRLEVKCQHRYVNWPGCDTQKVLLEPMDVFGRFENARVSLKDPIEIRLFNTEENATIIGSFELASDLPAQLNMAIPKDSFLVGLLRGMFLCDNNRASAKYEISGSISNFTCQ